MATVASPELSKAKRRSLGAYYTPSGAVELMARWVMARAPGTILEPSFGDGAFLRAVQAEAGEQGVSPSLVGAELNPAAFQHAINDLHVDLEGHAGDFLAMEPRLVDAVIGNPPFVRLRHLEAPLRESAARAARVALDEPMDPAGSTWMAFILHATRFLAPDGCLALVVPLEITHVRYARPLWRFLGAQFGRVKVVRTYDRMFPDLLQDVAVLLCEGRGDRTAEVEFQATHALGVLDDPGASARIPLDDLRSGERAFTAALLPPDLRALVADTLIPATRPIRDVAKVRIGYVAGDKNFFHPDPRTVRGYRLPARSLVPTVTRTRALKGAGLFTSAATDQIAQSLWRPDPARLTQGEERYIAAGEGAGVSKRYKCAIRSPWFVVPGVSVPDVIVSVFSSEPILMLNDGGLVASNSLLTANLAEGESAADLAAGWFTSVTQLFVELEVHSLGGGVLIAVPNELAKVRVPTLRASKAHLRKLDRALASSDLDAARAVGDQALVSAGLITAQDLQAIRRAIDLLRDWRERPVQNR